ncbi:MAG: hypothetical protein ACRDQ7_17930 [Haloechinothrix sp.]
MHGSGSLFVPSGMAISRRSVSAAASSPAGLTADALVDYPTVAEAAA